MGGHRESLAHHTPVWVSAGLRKLSPARAMSNNFAMTGRRTSGAILLRRRTGGIDCPGEAAIEVDTAAMPPRLNLLGACRSLAIRSRPPIQAQRPRLAVLARRLSDDASRPSPPSPEPPIEFILPEATAELAKSSDSAAALEAGGAEAQPAPEPVDPENAEALRQLERLSQGLNPFNPKVDGHKYGIPETPWQQHTHLKDRYDPVLAQVTRLMMRHGKLAKAQRVHSPLLPPPLQQQPPFLPVVQPSPNPLGSQAGKKNKADV